MLINRIFFVLIFINIYFSCSLFRGNNNILQYLSLKKEITLLSSQRQSLIKERYSIEKIESYLSSDNIEGANDILDEIIRQKYQYSSPDEKIIILND